ncbi:hypothetical protein [Brachyspira pulli]|uniref:hypothetical protein n=1 Tax=Brachyspira pulli TaxID=310721 RepID=UPI003004DD19
MFFKKSNILFLSSIIFIFSFVLIFFILGQIERIGYISEFSFNKSLSKNNQYSYNFKINYYSKIFKNSDIYSVHIDTYNVLSQNNFIKEIKMQEEGSPFGTLVSTKELKHNDKIENIHYKLTIKPTIFYSLLLLILIVFILTKVNKNYLLLIINNEYFSIVISFIICSILIHFLLPIIDKIPQIYNDIFISYPYSVSIANISRKFESVNEVNFRLLLYVIASVILIIIEFFKLKLNNKSNNSMKEYLYIPYLFIIPLLVFFIITNRVDSFILSIILISIILYFKYKTKIIYFPIISFLILYFFKSIFVIANICFDIKVSLFTIYLLTLIFSILSFILLADKDKKCILKFILSLQFFIPLYILSYLTNKYNYNGNIITLKNEHLKFQIIIFIIFLVLFLSNLFIIKKRKCISLKHSITLPTIIVVFIGNLYGSYVLNRNPSPFSALFVPWDFYHYADEAMAWHQVFNLNQVLFKDFSHFSGLFSMVYGFFHNVILNGYASESVLAGILLTIFYSVIIAVLLYKNTNSIFTFFTLSIFSLSYYGYSRIYLILPIMLLLCLPKLINNRGIWIPLWIFLVFLYGLYYPTYGFAMMLGTLPFGIIQIFFYVKDKELLKDIKTPKFYILWIIILIPILLSIPLLLRMMNWILLQSGQSKFLDGIKIFGTNSPNWFLPNISNMDVKNNIYYIIRIMIPVLSELISINILINLFKNSNNNYISILKSQAFLILSFIIIAVPLVSFSTFIREDFSVMAARTGWVLVPCISVLIPTVLLFYTKDILSNRYKYITISILIIILILIKPQVVNNNYNKIFFSNIIDVPDNMELIDDKLLNEFPSLGNGFIYKNNKNMLLKEGMILKKITTTNDSIAMDRYFGLYIANIINRKVFVTPIVTMMQSTKFAEYALNKLEENPPAVFIGDPQFYPWLVEKEYKICPENRNIFIRPDKFKEVYGTIYASNDMSNFNYYTHVRTNYYLPQALGRSIDNLTKYFTNEYVVVDKNTSYTNNEYIFFNEDISGKNYDYLYLELNNSKSDKIIISWGTEDEKINNNNSLTFIKSKEDKYLVPIGIMNTWRFNRHRSIRIIFNRDKNTEIKKLIFYKRNIL